MSQTTHTQTDGPGTRTFHVERIDERRAERIAIKRAIVERGRQMKGSPSSDFIRAHQRVLCRAFWRRTSRVDISQYPLGQE